MGHNEFYPVRELLTGLFLRRAVAVEEVACKAHAKTSETGPFRFYVHKDMAVQENIQKIR